MTITYKDADGVLGMRVAGKLASEVLDYLTPHVQPGITTNMTVITNQRIYAMQLATLYGPTPDMAFTVRYNYPPDQAQSQAQSDGTILGRYRLSGQRSIRPARSCS